MCCHVSARDAPKHRLARVSLQLDLHDPILVGYSLGARVALHVADASANQDAPKLGGVLCVSGSPGIEQGEQPCSPCM